MRRLLVLVATALLAACGGGSSSPPACDVGRQTGCAAGQFCELVGAREACVVPGRPYQLRIVAEKTTGASGIQSRTEDLLGVFAYRP